MCNTHQHSLCVYCDVLSKMSYKMARRDGGARRDRTASSVCSSVCNNIPKIPLVVSLTNFGEWLVSYPHFFLNILYKESSMRVRFIIPKVFKWNGIIQQSLNQQHGRVEEPEEATRYTLFVSLQFDADARTRFSRCCSRTHDYTPTSAKVKAIIALLQRLNFVLRCTYAYCCVVQPCLTCFCF